MCSSCISQLFKFHSEAHCRLGHAIAHETGLTRFIRSIRLQSLRAFLVLQKLPVYHVEVDLRYMIPQRY